MRGRPIGVSIVGRSVGELIAFWSFAISQCIKLSKLSSMVAPYKTISEVNISVIGDNFSSPLFENIWIKRVSNLYNKGSPDAC